MSGGERQKSSGDNDSEQSNKDKNRIDGNDNMDIKCTSFSYFGKINNDVG